VKELDVSSSAGGGPSWLGGFIGGADSMPDLPDSATA
jgi:hypothetical protein